MNAVVLMATHNGAAFVEQQTKSILEQDYTRLSLIIRDDGSQDATCKIVSAMATNPRVKLIEGENVGLPHAFLYMLSFVPDDAGAVFLSDQDDVWMPGKVAAAMQCLASAQSDTPTLYCSRLQLADTNLNPIGLSPLWTREPNFGNALVQNICSGCSVGFNRPALDLLKAAGPPAHGIAFHDWWTYLVVSAFGIVHYDPTLQIHYRIHPNNNVGLAAGRLDLLPRRTQRLWKQSIFDTILTRLARLMRTMAANCRQTEKNCSTCS